MRIISLLPSATEILFQLGCGEQVVAVSHECNFPTAARALPAVTRSKINSSLDSGAIDDEVRAALGASESLYELDQPGIVRLAPDLIVTQSQCDVCAIKLADVRAMIATNDALRHTELLTLAPNSLAEVFADLTRIAAAARLPDEHVAKVQRDLRDRVAVVVEQVDKRKWTPKAAVIEWLEPMMLAGNWTPELLQLAGGQAGLVTMGEHSPYVSWGSLAEYEPDKLIIAPCGFDLERGRLESQSLAQNSIFRELQCVREGDTFLLDGDAYLNRSGPRLVDTLEILAHVLHPDLAPSIHTQGWARWC